MGSSLETCRVLEHQMVSIHTDAGRCLGINHRGLAVDLRLPYSADLSQNAAPGASALGNLYVREDYYGEGQELHTGLQLGCPRCQKSLVLTSYLGVRAQPRMLWIFEGR